MQMFELKDIPLFSGLKKEQLELLQSQMHVHQYSKDSVVFYEGDISEYLQILLDGTVRLYKTSPKGMQVHMHNFSAPEIIALFVAFENVPFPATCEFLTEGVVGLLHLDKIYECSHDIDFSMSLVGALSNRMKLISDLFHKETIYSSEAKIADVIYNNPTVFERLKNGEIASMLNITPETLSRILTKFKKEKIITMEHHVVTVLNKIALQSVIDNNTLNK